MDFVVFCVDLPNYTLWVARVPDGSTFEGCGLDDLVPQIADFLKKSTDDRTNADSQKFSDQWDTLNNQWEKLADNEQDTFEVEQQMTELVAHYPYVSDLLGQWEQTRASVVPERILEERIRAIIQVTNDWYTTENIRIACEDAAELQTNAEELMVVLYTNAVFALTNSHTPPLIEYLMHECTVWPFFLPEEPLAIKLGTLFAN